MNVNPARNYKNSAKIDNGKDNEDVILNKRTYYQKLKRKIKGVTNRPKVKSKRNVQNIQKKLNHDEIANASYMVDQTNSNNTTINNNTLNNRASHIKGIESHMNSNQIPHSFYQKTYNQQKRIHYRELRMKLQKQLGKNKQQQQHIHKPSHKHQLVNNQQYLYHDNGPTMS